MTSSDVVTINIYTKLWLVKVVQHLMVAHLKDAKIMGLAAPIAATN